MPDPAGAMKRNDLGCALLLLVAMLLPSPSSAQRVSDDDIKKQMIQESIAGYSGAYPCPESRKKTALDAVGVVLTADRAGGECSAIRAISRRRWWMTTGAEEDCQGS